MNVGSVFFDRDFDFGDGETGRKLFVVLGTVGGISVTAKTTTKQHGRGTTYGCQMSDRFPNFFLPHRCCDLNATTWVCLDVFYSLDYSTVLRKRYAGSIDPVCDFRTTMARQIQDCALLSNDISTEQEAIVRACLVAGSSSGS